MTESIYKNPHDCEKDQQAWADHLMDCLYDAVYGSIDEDAGTDDSFGNPSFGEAECHAVNMLLVAAASVFLQHGIEDLHGNLERYVGNLQPYFIGMREARNNG